MILFTVNIEHFIFWMFKHSIFEYENINFSLDHMDFSMKQKMRKS